MPVRRAPGGLIGRQAELAAIIRLIDADDDAIALVAGEPGIGKSRLAREAIERTGTRPMVGAASPASLGRPYDLLLSAVEPVVRWWTAVPPSLTGLSTALSQLLGPVAPALPAIEPPSPPTPSDLTGAAIALLRELAPDLLLLEDIHWADVESLQVIERSMAGPEHPTIICTYRPEEVDRDHPAAALLRVIERRPDHVHLYLSAFSADEVHAYVLEATGDDLDARSLHQLLRRTGGNPFFLEQLVDCGFVSSDLDEQLPRTLAESIRRQLDALAPDERELLAIAAVVGSPFEFDLLAAAAELSESELIARLRGTVERGVLVEEDTDLFRFRHELVREAIVESLLGRERRRLHNRSFEALRDLRPTDYAELARHARGAERFDDLVGVAPQGVRHYLSSGSTFQAYKLAKAALAELPGHPELIELAARSGWLAGRHTDARELAQRWLEHAQREEPQREHAALELLARLAFETGDWASQLQVIHELETRIECAEDDARRAKMLAVLAQHRMLRHDLDEAVTRADEAIQLATKLDLDGVRRSAMLEKLSAAMCLENGETAVEGLQAIAKEAEAADDHLTAARAWHNVLVAQDVDDAAESLQRMRDAAVRLGADTMAQGSYAEKRVGLAMRRADLNDARHWAGRLRLIGKGANASAGIALTEAHLAVESGDVGEAERLLDDLPSDETDGGKDHRDRLAILRAVIAARSGNPQGVADALERITPTVEFPVAFILAAHDLFAAGAAPSLLEPLIANTPGEGCDEVVQIAQSMIDAQRGDESARADLIRSLDAPMHSSYHPIYPETNERLIRAEVRLMLAELDHADGNTASAHAHARSAAELLENWPGTRRARALALLTRGESLDTSGLTGRELDVVRLVARGLTNGQIADELFIARKTVSTHVSNVLAKLDMESRTQVAHWAVQEGIATVS